MTGGLRRCVVVPVGRAPDDEGASRLRRSPRGRVTEITGPASSGKSILSFHLLANAQRQGGFVALVDAAHQASFEQVRRSGVGFPDLFLVVPKTTHETFEIATLLVESGGLDTLVIDGIAELVGESVTAGPPAPSSSPRPTSRTRSSSRS